MSKDYETYDLGSFALQSGHSLPSAFIAYKTFGSSSNPAVLYPSWYSGLISDNEWLIGEDKTLNPKSYFIIITALFGNGQSTSPSNSPDLAPFPDATFYDNVKAQHRLLTEKLGVKHLRAVLGWSMGAAQSFQWATQFPDFMDISVPFCGSAKTSIHNQVFLEGVKSALLAGKGVSSKGSTFGRVEGKADAKSREWTEEERTVGLKAFGRGYAGWGFSQAFYREKLHEKVYGAFPDRLSTPRNPGPFCSHPLLTNPPSRNLRSQNTRRLHDLLLGRLGPEQAPRKPPDHAPHLASRRRQQTRTLQRRL